MRQHQLTVLNQAAVEVDRGPAPQPDPLRDPLPGNLVVFPHDIIPDAVEVLPVHGHALVGTPGLPAPHLFGYQAMVRQLGLRRGRERGEPDAGRLADRVGGFLRRVPRGERNKTEQEAACEGFHRVQNFFITSNDHERPASKFWLTPGL